MLLGARMVTASETTEGRAWDEQRIKALTGNDPITARFMRQDNFTYQPQFKLLLIGNSKPVLRAVDEAWRSRFHIIPFTHKPTRPDPSLKARLRDDYPRILSWAIDGYQDWTANGLQPTRRVLNETASYFESQDTFANWLEDCCIVDKRCAEVNAVLFRSWSAYCEKYHEQPGGGRAFTDRLAARGFVRIKDEFGIRGRGFQGLQVVPLSNLDGA
jgi:putative DNA primase/helicase